MIDYTLHLPQLRAQAAPGVLLWHWCMCTSSVVSAEGPLLSNCDLEALIPAGYAEKCAYTTSQYCVSVFVECAPFQLRVRLALPSTLHSKDGDESRWKGCSLDLLTRGSLASSACPARIQYVHNVPKGQEPCSANALRAIGAPAYNMQYFEPCDSCAPRLGTGMSGKNLTGIAHSHKAPR